MDVKCDFVSLFLLLAIVSWTFFYTLTLVLPHLFNWLCGLTVP